MSLFWMEELEQQRREGVPRWLKQLKSTTTRLCLVYYYLVTLDNGDLWLIVGHVLDGPKGNPIFLCISTRHSISMCLELLIQGDLKA